MNSIRYMVLLCNKSNNRARVDAFPVTNLTQAPRSWSSLTLKEVKRTLPRLTFVDRGPDSGSKSIYVVIGGKQLSAFATWDNVPVHGIKFYFFNQFGIFFQSIWYLVFFLLSGSGLCVVATLSEDTHHIDVEECQRRGIELVTLPKMSKDTVANLTMGILRQTLEGK